MSPYNLRRKKTNLRCYLQEGRILPQFNPVVVIKEKVPDIDINCNRFYVKGDKIIIRKTLNNYYKSFFMKISIISFIICLSSLYYFQVDIQDYFKSQMNSYNKNEASDTSEIRNLVLSALDESEEKEEEKKLESPMSFIQEECLRSEDRTNLEDSVTTVNDTFDDNLTDYALESKGARIVTIFDTKHYGFVLLKFWGLEFGSALNFFYDNYFYSKAPNTILMPWRRPGDCWAFKGSYGRVKIELWDQIRISAITIDHVRSENFSLEDISSAPKTFSVVASENENSRRIFLGTFEYRITGPSVQTFPISSTSPKLMRNPCRFVEITIVSNHGNQDYTCLYRVRVHGRK